MPHEHRKEKPFAEDIIKQLQNLLKNCKELKPNDCVIVLGDFNCELQRNVQGCTGKWLMNRRPDDGHSDKVLNLMRCHDLFAVDSLFRPKQKYMFGPEKRRRVCNATWLQKDKSLRPKKLDYFLVSNRWKSCVKNSATNWAPSFHRFGEAFDHSMLQISWTWRIRNEKRVVTKNFKAMSSENWQQLDNEIGKNLRDTELHQEQNSDAGTDERLHRMNTCIKDAIDKCVPCKKTAEQH